MKTMALKAARIAVVIAAAASLAACGSSDSTADDGLDTVKIGQFPGIVTNSQVWLGGDEFYGTFKKHGLKVEIVPGSPQISTAQLVSGEVDIVASNALSVYSLRDKGENVKLLSKLSTNLQIMLARSDQKIEPGDFAALKGKRIGVLGLNNQATVQAMLVGHGVDPSSITFTIVPDDPTGRSLLKAKEFDFYVTIEPGASAAVTEGFARVWMDFRTPAAGDLQKQPNVMLFAKSSWLDQNKDVAKRVQQAVQETIDTAKADPTKAVDLIVKGLPDGDTAAIRRLAPEEIKTWAGPVTQEDITLLNQIYVKAAKLAKKDEKFEEIVWQP
ncbi:ABC-type nitrate/sulfonate/bicarbonate transport system, substrate-binding protein [Sinosporangium album]|uniref:ABC-type nitrate/sulfonate/bicarbonate transport system, substrate-binding protein n=1 Tax=Sinosporangium album TaxID=504805 RepID=A0A1G8FPU4_9ACTN|nr:ABC transporter substrate-binding protein [Sinosporangium album]SDH84182.1 ABC-type nitrate/sulfonate/bicarbonate transport system, substrate-binding protein [Sinosporangium album]